MVLEGGQGKAKSTLCYILARGRFSDSLPEIQKNDKDAQIHLSGKWLIEIAEMDSFKGIKATKLKAFLTQTTQIYRPPYGRHEIEQPRQCVFIGTTNDEKYLKDDTGGRRFWPVKVGNIDIAALERDVDQLFAEAVKRRRVDGEQYWPDREFEERYFKPEQEARFEEDAWFDITREYLAQNKITRVFLRDLAMAVLQLQSPKEFTREHVARFGSILRRLGFETKTCSKTRKDAYVISEPLSYEEPEL